MSSPSATESWTSNRTEAEAERARSRVRRTASNLILHLHPTRVPAAALRFTYTWGLGGISALLALMLGMTGVMLMFRYEPSIERAYTASRCWRRRWPLARCSGPSTTGRPTCWSSPAFSTWSASFSPAASRRAAQRQLADRHRLVLMLVLAFNFTGYLLPWDQLAYWAITVSTSLIGYIPVVGPGSAAWCWPDRRWGRAP